MTIKKKEETSVELNVVDINRQSMTFHVLGVSPLIYNAMSSKTLGSLLVGSQPKTRAEKATTVKHDPPNEYRESVYCRRQDEIGPTRLILPAHLFKASIREAALRMPGATKTQINQLVQVEGINVDLYGIPQIIMNVMRSADMNRTPDIRTRAVVPEWACKVDLNYISPMLNASTIGKLFTAAGQIMGVGDSRPQKGYAFGKYEIVAENDKRFQSLIKSSTMAKQDAALRHPVCFDRETERLLAMFEEYMKGRDKPSKKATPIVMEETEAKPRGRRKRNGAENISEPTS